VDRANITKAAESTATKNAVLVLIVNELLYPQSRKRNDTIIISFVEKAKQGRDRAREHRLSQASQPATVPLLQPLPYSHFPTEAREQGLSAAAKDEISILSSFKRARVTCCGLMAIPGRRQVHTFNLCLDSHAQYSDALIGILYSLASILGRLQHNCRETCVNMRLA